ncbi:ROK family transcriptional regulator [Mesorhizobium sp. BR1-1-16]|uniref:ROK family transcriptional regulator n=1 Tax=Mesorhizobium sp. BR1-1-16 TaxID=2876653 RepID=UPI001CCC7410|nr:ROK family transcriptional regulator [Mesorhizobium sp. BR1-1-16]MBZ9938966.1 ROK family transcriptional regulator [Mesorhizobium sp. BR1-1-16]
MNSKSIRRHNTAALFHAIRQHPGTSQSALRGITSIDRSTVSTVVHQLEVDGLLKRSRGKPSYGMGRPEDQLEIEPTAGLLIGLALSKDGRLSVAGAGLNGIIQTSTEVELRLDTASSEDALIAELARFRESMPHLAAPIRGIGLLVEGAPTKGQPGPGARSIIERSILTRIEDFGGGPIEVAYDVHAFALAERYNSAAGDLDDFLYIHVDSIVRGVPFLGGRIHHGISGLTQRFGHMIVDPNGRLAEVGGPGSLNAYLSTGAILGRLAEFGVRARTLDDAVLSSRVNEALVRTVLSEAGSYLGVAIANALNVLDIGTVVLGGALVPIFNYLDPAIRQMILRDVVDPLGRDAIVRPSLLGRKPVAQGAIALAMQSFLPLV